MYVLSLSIVSYCEQECRWVASPGSILMVTHCSICVLRARFRVRKLSWERFATLSCALFETLFDAHLCLTSCFCVAQCGVLDELTMNSIRPRRYCSICHVLEQNPSINCLSARNIRTALQALKLICSIQCRAIRHLNRHRHHHNHHFRHSRTPSCDK